MKLTVSFDDNIVQLDVYDDMELENLIAYVQAEVGTPKELVLLHNAKPLTEMKKTIKQLGIKDNDMVLAVDKVMLQAQPPANQHSGPQEFGSSSSSSSRPLDRLANDILSVESLTMEQAASFRENLLRNPEEVNNLKMANAALAEALTSGSLEDFHRVLNEQHKKRREYQQRRMRMMNADPFDVEAQRMIAEEIKMQEIEQNMHTAIEYMPEAFGQVQMLYINCKVNGHPIKAFVDSGAQSTIMSRSCAERCNITRLIDERWSGIAQGVGNQKIIGRIHMCQIQIESDFLASSLNVLESTPMEMLLGLDMLKRHQCVIDLKTNVLKLGTSGTETKFLSEAESKEATNLGS